MAPDCRTVVSVQNYLADLAAVKVKNQIWGMSAEDYLVFLRETV